VNLFFYWAGGFRAYIPQAKDIEPPPELVQFWSTEKYDSVELYAQHAVNFPTLAWELPRARMRGVVHLLPLPQPLGAQLPQQPPQQPPSELAQGPPLQRQHQQPATPALGPTGAEGPARVAGPTGWPPTNTPAAPVYWPEEPAGRQPPPPPPPGPPPPYARKALFADAVAEQHEELRRYASGSMPFPSAF
jgi:hypothetical protein